MGRSEGVEKGREGERERDFVQAGAISMRIFFTKYYGDHDTCTCENVLVKLLCHDL